MKEASGPSLFNRHQPMVPYMYQLQPAARDRQSMRAAEPRHQVFVPSTHQLSAGQSTGGPRGPKPSQHPGLHLNSAIGQPSLYGSQAAEDNRNHLGRLIRPRDEQLVRRIGNLNPALGMNSMGHLSQQPETQSQIGSSRNMINIFSNSPTDIYINSPRNDIHRNNLLHKGPVQHNRSVHAAKTPASLNPQPRDARQTAAGPQQPKNALHFVYGSNNPASYASDLYSDKSTKESGADLDRLHPARQSQTHQKQPLELAKHRRAYTPQRNLNPLCRQLAPFSPTKTEPGKVACGCRKLVTGVCEYADEWLQTLFDTPDRPQDRDANLREQYLQILQQPRNEEDEKQIDNDVTRTYPELQVYTRKGPDASKLSNVLNAIAIQNPIIGYVQGINFIVASLMFHLREEHLTFFVFARLMDLLDLRELYRKGTRCSPRPPRPAPPRRALLREVRAEVPRPLLQVRSCRHRAPDVPHRVDHPAGLLPRAAAGDGTTASPRETSSGWSSISAGRSSTTSSSASSTGSTPPSKTSTK